MSCVEGIHAGPEIKNGIRRTVAPADRYVVWIEGARIAEENPVVDRSLTMCGAFAFPAENGYVTFNDPSPTPPADWATRNPGVAFPAAFRLKRFIWIQNGSAATRKPAAHSP